MLVVERTYLSSRKEKTNRGYPIETGPYGSIKEVVDDPMLVRSYFRLKGGFKQEGTHKMKGSYGQSQEQYRNTNETKTEDDPEPHYVDY